MAEINWRQNIVECGQRYSQVMEENFIKELKRADLLKPEGSTKEESDQNTLQMLEIMFDYLIGTSVGIASHYASTEEAFEENFVDIVRDKFVRLREYQAQVKPIRDN